MIQEPDIKSKFRYERKFLITDTTYQVVLQILKLNPACFSEIFEERRINNIYFDSKGLSSFYDNIDGEKARQKVRIRWYGDTFSPKGNVLLEFKIKDALLGRKSSFALNNFSFKDHFSKEELFLTMKIAEVPKHSLEHVLSLSPVLMNTYQRKYFLSSDKKFRVTIDRDLEYFSIKYGKNTFLNRYKDLARTVLELKYNAEDEEAAIRVASEFPFPLTKNSKYVSGVGHLVL